jgi:hypothetical protein
MKIRVSIMSLVALVSLSSCTPRVDVVAPDKPITINLNVKIDHEVRVKVDRDLESVFAEDSELF